MRVGDLLEQAWATGKQTVDGWGASIEATAGTVLSRGVATVLDLIDLDVVVERLPVDELLQRLDVAAIVEEVLAQLDLSAIIRQSSESVASDAVRAGRTQAMAMDSAISSVADRLLHRRARARTAPAITAGTP